MTAGRLAFFALVAIGWLAVTAHIVVTVDSGGDFVEARWDRTQPISLALWDGMTANLPQIAEGTDVGGTISAALQAWVEASELTVVLETTPQRTRTGAAGLNLVTLPQEGGPDAALLESGVLATTVLEITPQGEIVDADVLFTPEPEIVADNNTVPQIWTTDETLADGLNLLSTARHEFGHFFNLAHSAHLDATMYFRSGHFPFHINSLGTDDVAGLNRFGNGPNGYRMVGLEQISGAIAGHVGRSGADIFGAVVVACDADGLSVASGISLPDGGYSIENLPAGSYTLYVQPLAGPTTPEEISGGVFDTLAPPDFQPQFYLGSSAPNVVVAAGAVTGGIDFEVGQAAPTLAPAQVGAETDINDGFTTSSFPGQANAGIETNVIVAGAEFEAVNALTLLGPHLAQTAHLGNVLLSDLTTPAALFKVDIGSAPRGAYPLLPRTPQELSAITGGLQIVHPLRFRTAFAQFIDFPALGGARLFLLNPALEGPDSAGAIDILDGSGSATNLELAAGNEVLLPPGGSISLESNGQQDFVGSARVHSDGLLGGAVLFDTLVGVTGVGASRPVYRFVAPVVISDSGGVDTGLALTNLDDRSADYFLQVQDKDGVVQVSLTSELAAGGHISAFIRELAGGLPSEFQGTVLLTSTRPLGAVAIRTAPGLFTTFPVVASHPSARLDFAHFVHVPGLFSSEIILLNPSSEVTATDVVVEFRNPAGANQPLTFNETTAADGRFEVDDIPPLGCVVLTGGGDVELVGALRVTGSVPLGGVVLFTSDDFGTTGVGASPAEAAFASVITRDSDNSIDTGFAVSNPKAKPLNLEISARSSAGQLVGGPIAVTVPANGHLSRFVSEDLDGLGGTLGLPAQFEGSLWIRTVDGERFAATILRQRLAPGSLTTFPAVATQPLVTPRR